MRVLARVPAGLNGRSRSWIAGARAKPLPRGDMSHLYAPHDHIGQGGVDGSQPQAWVASTTTSAPTDRAAATMSAYRATSPVADWTS